MCSSAARRTICARVLSRASRVERYNVSKASSCSGLRVGIRIGFMGSSFSHKPTPLGNNLIVLSPAARLNGRVELTQLRAGVLGREAPIDARPQPVAPLRPRLHLPPQPLDGRQPPPKGHWRTKTEISTS